MKRIHNFVKNTFKDIPKENRNEIIEEVTQTLTEKVEDLVESGCTIDEAIDQTVMEFGSAEDYINVEPEEHRTILKRLKTLGHYRNDVIFSIIGALIIIGMLIFTNLTFTKDIIWFVLPALAVLWWPLAVVYHFLNKKEGMKNDNE